MTPLRDLRATVDAATDELVAADEALECARLLEQEAVTTRAACEAQRNAALANLTEARAVLDRRLGIGPATPPPRAVVVSMPAVLRVEHAPGPGHADDDDPVR
jgi:hypothetical protein